MYAAGGCNRSMAAGQLDACCQSSTYNAFTLVRLIGPGHNGQEWTSEAIDV